MIVAKKYIVLNAFDGQPKKSDFKIVEEELPGLQENEFLAEAAYFSVDPYQRMKAGDQFPCNFIGGQVAKIIESKHSEYPVGTWVMGHFGWRTHTICKPGVDYGYQKPFMYKLPDFGDLPVSLAAGMCGRAGNTAYFGFTEICKPKPGETVVVSGAAGAVGSHVGQIAKILAGCRVLGIAGSDEKCNCLVNELGFDAAVNYKTGNIGDFLKQNAPNGVDCYFDNVGGEISSTVMSQMKQYGRVSVCGAISIYNEPDPEKRKATAIQLFVVSKQLKIEGFLVNQFADRTMEGVSQNLQWVKEGKLKYKEYITEGFESAVDAFIGIFRGDNIGKALVKV